jgi:hypothetical protein
MGSLYRTPHKEGMEFLLESFKILCAAVPESAGRQFPRAEGRLAPSKFPHLSGQFRIAVRAPRARV